MSQLFHKGFLAIIGLMLTLGQKFIRAKTRRSIFAARKFSLNHYNFKRLDGGLEKIYLTEELASNLLCILFVRQEARQVVGA